MIGYKKCPHAQHEHSKNTLILNVDDQGIHYDFTFVNSMDALVSYRKDANKSCEDRYTGYLSLDDLSRCTSSNQKINQPHAIIGVGFRYKSKPRVFDFFRHTSESKSTTGHVVAATLGIQQGFYFIRPWADTPISEWKVFLSAEKIIINGIEQEDNYLETINGNGLNDIISMFPSISLSFKNNTIFAQVLNPDGTEAHKKDIEIFLETTTGLLRENRLITDKFGRAQTDLLFAGKGKIKAGFKFYTGKAEIQID